MLALNRNECNQIVKFISLIGRSLLEVFYLEDIAKVVIDQFFSDTETCTDQLPSHFSGRLYQKLLIWKL